MRLLKEYVDTNPALCKKLICAYIIGATVENQYDVIIPCDSASQTGCMVSWRSAKWGTTEDKYFFQKSRVCTNPLSWTRDSTYVSAQNNHGSIPLRAKRMDVNLADARISQSILWVHKPKKSGYLRNNKNYHIMDYALFWMNIRENVKLRVDQYLSSH
jgi:hypothetical protein